MTIKIISAAVVIIGCGYLGILISSRQKMRIRQIDVFIQFLKAMEFNVVYLKLPVTECLSRIAAGSEGVLRKLLEDSKNYLECHRGAQLGEAWRWAAERQHRGIYTGKEVLDILSEFASRFGSGNEERERENIAFTLSKLQYIRDGLSAHLQSDMKLYRGLGFLSGILLVILLF